MSDVSTPSRQKSWQSRRERLTVQVEMAVTRKRVAEQLVELRRQHGSPEKPLTQEDAAHKAGVTTRQWQRWESGASMPYTRNLSQVAEAFGISMDYFDEGPREPTPDVMASLNGDSDSNTQARLARLEHYLSLLLAHQGIDLKDLPPEVEELARANEEAADADREGPSLPHAESG